jgi:hypothetical protein
MRRIEWELDWLIENEKIDPERVCLLGGSMGGRGANYLARALPERFSAWFSRSPGNEPMPNDPLVGSTSQNVKTNLPGSPGIVDVMNLYSPISGNQRDIPFGKIVVGRADEGAASGWRPEMVQSFVGMNATGFGCHLYWDERAHGNSSGAHWDNSSRHKAKELTKYRNNQSFPAFFNDDQDFAIPGRQPDIGDGDPLSGDVWGTWGGYYDWDTETIVDSATKWEATVFLHNSDVNPNDVPSFDSSLADVSIRRPQHFTPAEGVPIQWNLSRLSDSRILHSGEGNVGKDSLVTIRDLTIYKDKCRLSVFIDTAVNDDHLKVPASFAGLLIYPNPFKELTSITYFIPKSAQVHLAVYNHAGQLVKMLINRSQEAGSHSVIWNATGIASGLYYLRLQTEEFTDIQRCVRLE